MTTPLSGTSGQITVGGTSVVWIGSWEAGVENGSQTVGPHVGDATEYEVDTSQKWTWKASGTVPSGGDAGQNLIFTNTTARTTAALMFETEDGKRITFSAAKFSKLNFKTEANGTQTFDAEGSNGSGTGLLEQDT